MNTPYDDELREISKKAALVRQQREQKMRECVGMLDKELNELISARWKVEAKQQQYIQNAKKIAKSQSVLGMIFYWDDGTNFNSKEPTVHQPGPRQRSIETLIGMIMDKGLPVKYDIIG